MDRTAGSDEGQPSPPARLFERLAQLSGYTWDQSFGPFHSSYDNWHVFGIQHRARENSAASSLNDAPKSTSSRSSPRPRFSKHGTCSETTHENSGSARTDTERIYIPVVARISTHILRIEREYHLNRTFTQTTDLDCSHTVRLLDLIRLPSHQDDPSGVLIVSIFESPGRNYLRDLLDFGPPWSPPVGVRGTIVTPNKNDSESLDQTESADEQTRGHVSLSTFLEFAIGAAECLELMHHGLSTVHGEIRGDAFYFNQETRAVKMINFGSGPRSFENGLTSTGWLSLSREVGIKGKLQFIAPEQTGRMPAEPDSRTDIYSLGILFWTMLTRQVAFEGESPMDVVQAMLGRKIPSVSHHRMDIPDVVSGIIQKMTQKQIDDRYHSISGLKYDLVQVQKIFGDGDTEALANFTIGSKDVSSFFVLPNTIFGREEEHSKILKIIEKVFRRQQTRLERSLAGKYAAHSNSTQSNSTQSNSTQSVLDPRYDVNENGTKFSDTSSHAEAEGGPVLAAESSSNVAIPHLQLESQDKFENSHETMDSATNSATNNIDNKGLQEIRNSPDHKSVSTKATQSTVQPHVPGIFTNQRTSHKYKRRGNCEVVTVLGAAGLGKSSLIQSIQGDIRRFGYFAFAKFEPARKAPFEPLFRAMGSLFRQIFSESDVNSDYHNTVRRDVRAVWPTLRNMLDLPESLIFLENECVSGGTAPSQHWLKRSSTLEGTDSMNRANGTYGNAGTHLPSDFLRGTANTGSLKFMNIFLDVLRVLSSEKLICLCLDDLQFADEESLDLISNIVARKFGIALIITCREEGMLSSNIRSVLDGSTSNVTRIALTPLKEHQVVSYVAAALYRSHEYVVPLAILCMERTSGNPFYLRQMLEVCHRKGCLWYSWKSSAWEYDIDRVFVEFETQNYGQQLNTRFITRRLQDLPQAARSILAWASLLGNPFSFKLVQRLLSGEFDYFDDLSELVSSTSSPQTSELFTPQPAEHVVEGLQAALQAYILMPGNDDDYFCFSHDRYIQASAQLRECHNIQKMHFIIVQTMMKYTDLGTGSLYAQARHVCEATSVIKRRVQHRSRFRELLSHAAQKAVESGARHTALKYYEACLELMQTDPWKDGAEDVFYDETLSVYTRAAELYSYQGQHSKAHRLIANTFDRARSGSDKAPAWILQSRLSARRGDTSAAFRSLQTSLLELGLKLNENLSWESCDEIYHSLQDQLMSSDLTAIIEKPFAKDQNIILIGAVLTEAISAAYWSDTLLFYQMAIKMVDFHLKSAGTFHQIGLGFLYFTVAGITRFADLSFGSQMYDVAHQLLRRSVDVYTLGRGLTISAIFITHMLTPIREHIDLLEEAMDHSLVCGDKHVFLFSVAGIALSRLFLGVDMAELENFCNVAPEDFGDWTTDLRGGTLLMVLRQIARALQGKTNTASADTVISDEHHDTAQYMEFINTHASNIERPRDYYNSLMMIPLFLFGHYNLAIQIGNDLVRTMHELWSCRNSRITYFYLSLSILAKLRENPSVADHDDLLEEVRKYKTQIDIWQKECNVNYLTWSLLVEAELNEMVGNHHKAIQSYETAIDHTELHDFVLEQALATELQGEFYIRRGAKRAARSTLTDAIATYIRIGAYGKANSLKAKHEWVLTRKIAARTVDVGMQTANSIGDIGNTQFRIEENERQETRTLGRETAGDRTQAWVGPAPRAGKAEKDRESLTEESGVYNLGLDVLDLQSILEFNQAISSELQIDRLLAQMTEIILESAGAQADFAAVIIEGESGWCIAASGTADSISSEAIPLSEIQDETQKQVLLYTMRFREVVFVHNVAHDARFCNKPSVKSVMSLPIIQGTDLLGILYLEGQPNSFTDRNLGVLQLLCNQVGISIANALLFRRIRKVSASNTSMIETQKRALAKAREAEIKAKLAEAEAMRNVRLKEEAAKAKSMFLANVSHELRTPLNGVIGMSELLKATALNKEQDGYADSIRVCADTLLTVINDILDFSKLEAGKMKLFSVPLNLKETITEVVRALSYTNLERGLQTIEDLDLGSETLVMGDPVRLHQIIMNLLSNSYKFTAKGSVTIRSRTEYEDENSIRVTCSIADTGIGITQEQVTRLFKPFSQADSSTQRSYGGSGLGLSICKALVNVLNGKIWLESQVGVGTTVSFTITFPKAPKTAISNNLEIATKDPDPMATWSSDSDGVAARTSTASFFDLTQVPRDQLRICIAEDNPINQKIAVSFVTKLGYKCEAYSDGLQAVEALRRRSRENQPFHLVLMDVQMPVLDGLQASALIRKDEDPVVRGVLIIAMTASAIRGDREKCLQSGMNNYLAKPVRAAVLKLMLEEYLTVSTVNLPNLQGSVKPPSMSSDGPQDESSRWKSTKKKAQVLDGRPDVLKRINSRNAVQSPDPIESTIQPMKTNGFPISNGNPSASASRPTYQLSSSDSTETVTSTSGSLQSNRSMDVQQPSSNASPSLLEDDAYPSKHL